MDAERRGEQPGASITIRHPASGIRHPASGIRHPEKCEFILKKVNELDRKNKDFSSPCSRFANPAFLSLLALHSFFPFLFCDKKTTYL